MLVSTPNFQNDPGIRRMNMEDKVRFPAIIKRFGNGTHVTIPAKYLDMIGVGIDDQVYITVEKVKN